MRTVQYSCTVKYQKITHHYYGKISPKSCCDIEKTLNMMFRLQIKINGSKFTRFFTENTNNPNVNKSNNNNSSSSNLISSYQARPCARYSGFKVVIAW